VVQAGILFTKYIHGSATPTVNVEALSHPVMKNLSRSFTIDMATEFSPATCRIVLSKMLFSWSVRSNHQRQNGESLARQLRISELESLTEVQVGAKMMPSLCRAQLSRISRDLGNLGRLDGRVKVRLVLRNDRAYQGCPRGTSEDLLEITFGAV
jgi:hypothetical protein